MTFTYNGFVKDTLEDIVARMSTRALNNIPNITLEPSNPMYQWFKVVALEEMYVQTMLEEAVANMTVMGASGIFLDYHGIEAGVFRKPGTEAFGRVECTRASPNDDYIEVGNNFLTKDSKEFLAYERVGFLTCIPMRRESKTYEILPSYYTGTSVAGLYYDQYFSNEILSGSIWSFANDKITWIDIDYLLYGTVYYVKTDLDKPMTISVPIVASTIGISSNVGADTITSKVGGVSIDSCTNVHAIYNGTDNETDEAYRYRIVSAGRKSSSLADIESMVNEVVGIEECKVYQNNASDRSITDNWEASLLVCTGIHYQQILSGTTYGFSFYPSTGIGTLQGITLNGKIVGNPPDLNFFINKYSDNTYNTGSAITTTYINRGVFAEKGEDVWQDIYIPLKINGLDHLSTYRIFMYISGLADENNCWQFTTTGYTPSTYRFYHFSGALNFPSSGFMYKTLYGVPGYTISVIPVEGYSFEDDIRINVEYLLDNNTGMGFSPIGIQYIVEEATKLYMGLSVTIYIEEDVVFSVLCDLIKANISAYLLALHPGDDIFYSQIERVILNTPGVERDRGLKINLNGGSWYDNASESDLQVGENEYVVLDVDGFINPEDGGVTFIEG